MRHTCSKEMYLTKSGFFYVCDFEKETQCSCYELSTEKMAWENQPDFTRCRWRHTGMRICENAEVIREAEVEWKIEEL